MKLLLKMIIVLGGITIVSACLMAVVNEMTAESIRTAEQRAQQDAIAAVCPVSFSNNPMDDASSYRPEPEGKDSVIVYPLHDGDKCVGAAVESYSNSGFDGQIRIMFGFDTDGRVTGYEVLQQTETPGLGSKMVTWFKENTGNRSVIGRDPATDNLTVSKDGGDIDGITAATISSRAFLDALRRASSVLTDHNVSQQSHECSENTL